MGDKKDWPNYVLDLLRDIDDLKERIEALEFQQRNFVPSVFNRVVDSSKAKVTTANTEAMDEAVDKAVEGFDAANVISQDDVDDMARESRLNKIQSGFINETHWPRADVGLLLSEIARLKQIGDES